jgi:hypothetical protein
MEELNLSSTELSAVITGTAPAVLQDRRLLQLFFTQPLPRGPEYLAAILQYLQVHVNFLYPDPLLILLTSIRDVLMRVTLPLRSKCPPTQREAETLTYLQQLTPSTLAGAVKLPQFYQHSVVHWRSKGRALVRPPEVSQATTVREDALVLTTPQLETFFSNSRHFLDVLLEYGLGQERLDYLSPLEQGQYLAPLLELFQLGATARIRRFAINYAFQLVPLGVDLYHDLFFHQLSNLLRAGSLKTLDDVLEPGQALGRNFDQVTDLLTFWLQAGYDVNYTYAQPLTFAEAYGVPSQESEESLRLDTVRYVGCSALSLVSIYNRADVVSWLLQFCGPLAIEANEEEDLFARTLDLYNPVLTVDEDDLVQENEYLTIAVTLRSQAHAAASACESNLLSDDDGAELDTFQLAQVHRSSEVHALLVTYREQLRAHWHRADPLAQDVRQIAYMG